ncbi:CSD domain-containing protein [Caenorhabditis elegans]|uniref:CSD domain-containing protein n=1 Tax=Caenorhabditis elegans TaxID=6239 RepID=P91398_CAEEL|nr:CSD domain-containing protein [Caenorhabditis elegans]CCD71344.1 CSD domain-containing protein [Caenorhabditis elegans]|eukprot:NP_491631.1 C. Elegans Y-box [Caenorhabditis elegans]
MSDTANTAVEVDEQVIEKKLDDLSIGKKRSPSKDDTSKHRLPAAERIRIWEEEQKAKIVLTAGLQGKVKWYSVLRRYGFISRSDGEKDVFVHQTAISKSDTEKFYLRTLADEEEVLFDLVDGKNGPEAANVTGPAGVNVSGSKYRHQLLSRFRKNRKPKIVVGEDFDSKETEKLVEAPAVAMEKKKQRKQRKNKNRKQKDQKGAGDAADSSATTESLGTSSETASPDSKSCTKIISEEAGLSKIDRCDSALDDAGLGAQLIDAQI